MSNFFYFFAEEKYPRDGQTDKAFGEVIFDRAGRGGWRTVNDWFLATGGEEGEGKIEDRRTKKVKTEMRKSEIVGNIEDPICGNDFTAETRRRGDENRNI
jgi:hypothetical protein